MQSTTIDISGGIPQPREDRASRVSEIAKVAKTAPIHRERNVEEIGRQFRGRIARSSPHGHGAGKRRNPCGRSRKMRPINRVRFAPLSSAKKKKKKKNPRGSADVSPREKISVTKFLSMYYRATWRAKSVSLLMGSALPRMDSDTSE